ncbi:hypothetical protein [Microbispora sp. NBRC 16548]|uniref:hypothetical protein n=1 Tax=Microbispora sp. NBRC 16548 TaxID=3030994 RepID=UPI00161CB3E7|nr:hypothetical protein [Microbispora sp. NBRC 16548]
MIRRLVLAGAACAAGIVVMAPIAASAETAAPRQPATTAQAGLPVHADGWGHGGWGHPSSRPWHSGYWGRPLGYWSRPLGYWSTPVVLVDGLYGDDCGADYYVTPSCD